MHCIQNNNLSRIHSQPTKRGKIKKKVSQIKISKCSMTTENIHKIYNAKIK